jgi:hypothetical protein
MPQTPPRHPEPCPLLVLPAELSDEAAAALLKLLQEVVRVLESHYAAQLRRYHHPGAARQLPLWPDQGPPF